MLHVVQDSLLSCVELQRPEISGCSLRRYDTLYVRVNMSLPCNASLCNLPPGHMPADMLLERSALWGAEHDPSQFLATRPATGSLGDFALLFFHGGPLCHVHFANLTIVNVDLAHLCDGDRKLSEGRMVSNDKHKTLGYHVAFSQPVSHVLQLIV